MQKDVLIDCQFCGSWARYMMMSCNYDGNIYQYTEYIICDNCELDIERTKPLNAKEAELIDLIKNSKILRELELANKKADANEKRYEESHAFFKQMNRYWEQRELRIEELCIENGKLKIEIEMLKSGLIEK